MSHDVNNSLSETILRPIKLLPWDLLVTMVLAIAGPLVGQVGPRVVAAPVGLVLVVFLSGYALLAALVPHAYREDGPRWGQARGLTFQERVGLSFGVSLLLLPPVGFLVVTFGAPVHAELVLEVLGGLTLAAAIVGTFRRVSLPEAEQFRLPYQAWAATIQHGLGRDRSLLDRGLNLGVALVALLTLVVLVSVVLLPPAAGAFTTFGVLTEAESGELVAANYPETLAAGEPVSLVLAVGNHEGGDLSYTVVGTLEDVSSDGAIADRTELGRWTVSVADGESANEPVTVTPQTIGEDQRLSFYLYHTDPPGTAGPESADEHVFVWVDVIGPS